MKHAGEYKKEDGNIDVREQTAQNPSRIKCEDVQRNYRMQSHGTARVIVCVCYVVVLIKL